MRGIAFVFALLATHGALAQEIEVRSGEHPTFSRLVFEFGTLPKWKLGRSETGFELVTDDSRSFDTSRVFDKIPANRLLDIRVGEHEGTVSLMLGCTCHADVFELREDLLVVDIHDGRAPPGNAFEEPLIRSAQYVQARLNDGPSLAPISVDLDSNSLRRLREISSFERPSLPSSLFYPTEFRDAPQILRGASAFQDALLRSTSQTPKIAERLETQPKLVPEFDTVVDRQQLQTTTANQTLETLGRAVAQGLVDAPNLSELGQAEIDRSADVSSLTALGSNISVSTSIDLTNDGFAPGVSGRRGGVCLSGSAIDVASWGDLDTPYTTLAKARSNLVGEFDVADLAAVRRLSRLYINMGFGSEARAVLKAFPSSDPETTLLLKLAEIVDATDTGEAGPLAGQLECESDAALWAALAQPFKAEQIRRSREQILSTFSSLPVHLRRHLGPTLMERLTSAGDTDAAATVLNAIRRDGFKGDLRLAMAVAALSSENGRPADPPAPNAVAGDTKLLSETILRRIAAGEENGTLPNNEDMALLPILAFELRGSATARDLRIAEINGYRRRGEIPPALAALRHATATGAIKQETAESLFRAVSLAAADSMTDASLLVFATTADERLGVGPISVEARRALADRLISLGFADTAEQMVDDIPGQALQNKLRLARIELARGAPEQALSVLDGFQEPEAAELRAQALSALAEYREAAIVWDGIGASKSALIARQRAGDWSNLETGLDALSAAATDIRQADDVPLADLNLDRVDGRVFRDAADAAVTASATRRQAIRALLDASDNRN